MTVLTDQWRGVPEALRHEYVEGSGHVGNCEDHEGCHGMHCLVCRACVEGDSMGECDNEDHKHEDDL